MLALQYFQLHGISGDEISLQLMALATSYELLMKLLTNSPSRSPDGLLCLGVGGLQPNTGRSLLKVHPHLCLYYRNMIDMIIHHCVSISHWQVSVSSKLTQRQRGEANEQAKIASMENEDNIWHIESETKGWPFLRRHYATHFLNKNARISIIISF